MFLEPLINKKYDLSIIILVTVSRQRICYYHIRNRDTSKLVQKLFSIDMDRSEIKITVRIDNETSKQNKIYFLATVVVVVHDNNILLLYNFKRLRTAVVTSRVYSCYVVIYPPPGKGENEILREGKYRKVRNVKKSCLKNKKFFWFSEVQSGFLFFHSFYIIYYCNIFTRRVKRSNRFKINK